MSGTTNERNQVKIIFINQCIIAHSVKDKYSSSETSQNDADHDSENSQSQGSKQSSEKTP